jgi:hypothetical protein
MKAYEAVTTLNRLLEILCRSLPAYLDDAQPWARMDARRVQAALDHFLADTQLYAERVVKAILDLGGRPQPGSFPGEFAAKNDLSLDFLLREVIESQEHDILAIGQCAARLESDSSLHALAEEILGNAKGHLEIIRGLGARG